MKRLTRTGYIVAGTTAGAVLLGGGVAYAYWTSSSSSTGAAAVGTTSDLTVTQPAGSEITGLYPDGPSQPVTVRVANPNSAAITLHDVLVTVTGTEKPAGTPNLGCTASDFSVTDVIAYTGESIPGLGSTASIVPKRIQLVDTGLDQNACKGATVLLSFSTN